MDIIKKDHTRKSNQVKQLKRKLKNKAKNTLPLSKLKELLAQEKQYKRITSFYMDNVDKEIENKEVLIDLLQELIKIVENG